MIRTKKFKKSACIYLILALQLYSGISVAQGNIQFKKPSPQYWTVYNRNVDYNDGVIHLDARRHDGVLWLNSSNFKNGTIELDIKGKDIQGQSFVGVAFHSKNDSSFNAVYFRPFNFKNPDRADHAVQYISMPDNDWSVLRNKFPGKYESSISPVPDPNEWFHAKVVVSYPAIKVYVNDSDQPTLEVEQIGEITDGKVGLWVGNVSEGWFKNISIIKTDQ